MPWRANVKSMVWYSPKAFADKGYKVPETLDEMKALSDQIVKDGGTPWCAGIESGVATGGRSPTGSRTSCCASTVPRSTTSGSTTTSRSTTRRSRPSPTRSARTSRTPTTWVGRTTSRRSPRRSSRTAASRSHRQLLHAPAGELLLDAAPRGDEGRPSGDTTADISYFYLPVAKAGDPKVMLGAGDILAAGTDKPETWDVIKYAPRPTTPWRWPTAARSSRPARTSTPSKITDPLLASFAELLAARTSSASTVPTRCPARSGPARSGRRATAWIVGGSTDDMLNNIEASWPK